VLGVDMLVPNQTEAQALAGAGSRPSRVRRKGVGDPKLIAMSLLMRGPRAVVLKLGPKGAMMVDRSGQIERARGFKSKVVDTTAAGDAFTGGLAVAHAEDQPMPEAMRFANAAGALCCTNFGAQPSLPTRADVDRLLATLATR
jgi:ribokinase